MVSKCANPDCSARFRYLSQGRIFNIETNKARAGSRTHARKMEHFWLCERCALILKIICENGDIKTIALNEEVSDVAEEGPIGLRGSHAAGPVVQPHPR